MRARKHVASLDETVRGQPPRHATACKDCQPDQDDAAQHQQRAEQPVPRRLAKEKKPAGTHGESHDELACEMPPRPHNAAEGILADGCGAWWRKPGPAARTEHHIYAGFKAALRASHRYRKAWLGPRGRTAEF